MEPLKLFKPGEKLSGMRQKLNALVRELKRLRNIQGAGIIVSHTTSGILLAVPKTPLTIDDKYLLDSDYNMNTMVRRLCDLMSGDIGDLWRVRAHPTGTVREVGERRTLPGFRLMWLVNYDGTALVEGGWLTDSADVGLGETEHKPEHIVATPKRRVAQIGDIVILTDDDEISETPDGDKYTLANIRHDAHQHMDEEHDGRIYFTTTPPGDEPSGFEVIGEMVGDPAKANSAYSLLKKESVEWRPQLKVPNLDIPGEIYNPRDVTTYAFPPVVRIPNSSVMAYEFGITGRDEGWSAHYQPHHKLDSYGLGFMIKYTAENEEEVQQDAFMELDYKLANDGEDISTAGMINADFTIPVPAGSTEQDLNICYHGFVPAPDYADKDLVICDHFARDVANVLDTLSTRLLVIEVKMIYMTVVVPP